MTQPDAPTIDTTLTGEEIAFEPEYADTLFWDKDLFHTREISDSGFLVRVEAEDHAGNDVVLTYALSQILVDIAEYDCPEAEVTATTAPANTTREVVYGADEYNPDHITLSDGPFTLSEDVRLLWDHALDIDVQADFMCATGIDSADPIGNQYDAYWILTHAAYKDAPGSPFFVHEKATQSAVLDRVLEVDARLDDMDAALARIEEKLDAALEG